LHVKWSILVGFLHMKRRLWEWGLLLWECDPLLQIWLCNQPNPPAVLDLGEGRSIEARGEDSRMGGVDYDSALGQPRIAFIDSYRRRVEAQRQGHTVRRAANDRDIARMGFGPKPSRKLPQPALMISLEIIGLA